MKSYIQSLEKSKFYSGQGFAEYALILAFVSVATMLAITILEPSVGDVFDRLVGREEISPPSLANYQAPPTPTFDPNYTPQPTNTPDSAATATALAGGGSSGGTGGSGSGGSGSGGGSATSTPTTAPTNTPTTIPNLICDQVFEAESASLNGNMRVGYDNNASNGQYVHVPDNWGNNTRGPNSHSATFSLAITHAGDYQIIGSVYANSSTNDSFWVSLNGNSALWDVLRNYGYDDDYVNNRNGDDPVTYSLTPGTYNLAVSLREDGTRLDKIQVKCVGGSGGGINIPVPTPTATPNSGLLLPAGNLCLNATVTQSSTSYGGDASRACDGDRSGVYSDDSVTHTDNESNAWWQADLGKVYILQQIKLFNRSDCCSDRLSNFYVFVSDEPFTSSDLDETLNHPGVDSFYFEGNIDSIAYAFTKQSGRYIRIQQTSSNPLSLAEVEIYGSQDIPSSCTAVIDMFYIIDRSGSMAYSISGATNRMEASKNAIRTVNNLLIDSGLDHRVGAVSYTATNWYSSGGYTRASVSNITYPMTGDIAGFNNTTLPLIQPQSYTPTGPALNDSRLAMIDAWDPLRVPVVILITDGAPNISRDEIIHDASEVANIDVYDGQGNPYALSTIQNFGSKVQGNSLRQGNVLVDVLDATEEMMASLPNATIHSIGLGDAGANDFNPQLLQYVADIGGGNYYAANSASALTDAITAIYNSVPSCDDDS